LSFAEFHNAIYDDECNGEWDVRPFPDGELSEDEEDFPEEPSSPPFGQPSKDVRDETEPEDSLFNQSVVPLEIDPDSPEGKHLNFDPIPPGNTQVDSSIGTQLADVDLLDLKRLSKTERLMVRLCDVARQAKAPLYLVDAIVEIVQDEARTGLDLKTPMLKREAFLGHLLSRFKVDPPEMYRVELETNQPKDVPYGPDRPPPKPPQLIDRKKEKMKLYRISLDKVRFKGIGLSL
jgi:hypothetical protein